MDYKKTFTIQKYLIKNKVPDDLFPIIFEYLGDITETHEDLINRWCFYELYYDHLMFVRPGNSYFFCNDMFGHYCRVCNKIYKINSYSKLKHHLEGNVHKYNLLKNPYQDKMTSENIQHLFRWKSYSFWSYDKDVKEQILKSIKLKQKEFIDYDSLYKKKKLKY